MIIPEKMLGIMMVQRKLSAATLFRQMLGGIAIFIVVSVIFGVLAGALLVNGMYMAYQTLLLNEIEPDAALMAVGSIALLIGGLLYGVLHIKIQKLQNGILRLLKMQSPIASRLNAITDSFMDGLLDPEEAEEA